jgi:hypothetical protein
MESYVTMRVVVDWDGTLVQASTVSRPRTARLSISTNMDPIMMPIQDLNQPTPAGGQSCHLAMPAMRCPITLVKRSAWKT